MFRIHESNPADAVEQAYVRILRERMADVPIHNDALHVEAVDFQRWQGHWLGILITPWSMNVLLVPGQADPWESVGDNRRRFIKFPSGDFAFLGSDESEVGEFQSCALFSPMSQFASQHEAVMTARASMIALMHANAKPETEVAADDQPSLSRRRFFGLGTRT